MGGMCIFLNYVTQKLLSLGLNELDFSLNTVQVLFGFPVAVSACILA